MPGMARGWGFLTLQTLCRRCTPLLAAVSSMVIMLNVGSLCSLQKPSHGVHEHSIYAVQQGIDHRGQRSQKWPCMIEHCMADSTSTCRCSS